MSGSLFDTDEPPRQAARLAPVLRLLAERGIIFGTSSWKYEGWLGSIYSRDRYLSRGRFSKKKFEADCLREYAETFPVVGGDFSFYQFPAPDYWSRLFAGVPPDFGFGLSRHNVAHIFNARTRMPTVADQMAIPGAFSADCTVVRALLQKGRGYEQAVSMFEPYEKVQDPDEGTRGP